MAERASMEDLETGADAEFERIKQNFRSTIMAPDLPANFPESQAAFQELQDELQEFLSQHIPKVVSLQELLALNVPMGGGGTTQDSHLSSKPNKPTRTSLHVTAPNADAPEMTADPLSRVSSVNRSKIPVNAHMQALQLFLISHMENIRVLQMSVIAPSTDSHTKHATISPSKAMPLHGLEGEKRTENLALQLYSIVAISTVTAVFVVGLLILSAVILSGRRQTAFNIGMLFAFFALAFHFGNIFLGTRAVNIMSSQSISTDKNKVEHDEVYFKFYLTVCEQLHLAATGFLIVSTLILAFVIFSSLAYPFLFLFLSAAGAIIIFISSYFKVLITVGNLIFLVKNVPRLGSRAVDYVKTNVDARR